MIDVTAITARACQRCPSSATLRFTDLATGEAEELCEECADKRFARMKRREHGK